MKPPLSSRISSKRQNAKPVQIGLIDELLDAHDGTSRLASAMGELDPAWRARLEYLRNERRPPAFPSLDPRSVT